MSKYYYTSTDIKAICFSCRWISNYGPKCIIDVGKIGTLMPSSCYKWEKKEKI